LGHRIRDHFPERGVIDLGEALLGVFRQLDGAGDLPRGLARRRRLDGAGTEADGRYGEPPQPQLLGDVFRQK
jgi:hypothetical protein